MAHSQSVCLFTPSSGAAVKAAKLGLQLRVGSHVYVNSIQIGDVAPSNAGPQQENDLALLKNPPTMDTSWGDSELLNQQEDDSAVFEHPSTIRQSWGDSELLNQQEDDSAVFEDLPTMQQVWADVEPFMDAPWEDM